MVSDDLKQPQVEAEADQPMQQALKITLDFPVKWKRIANGEKVIWQTGPDEWDVEIVESLATGKSPIVELFKLIDDGERQMRKRRKVQIPSS